MTPFFVPAAVRVCVWRAALVSGGKHGVDGASEQAEDDRVAWSGGEEDTRFGFVLDTNDVDSLIAFAALGLGITLLPDFMVSAELKVGDLVQLTTPDQSVPAEVFAMSANEWRSDRVEAVLDRLTRPLAE